MSDLVSIIMPSYNTAQYITETIQSVIDQTYHNWELIIVDDCSTDNTDIVIGKIKDPRIRYIKNEKNSGAAVSRNRALREANGRWVAFLDSDDLWKPEKLEKQICFMMKNRYYFSYTNYEESLNHETNVQEYKINTFGFHKAYCKMHIQYRPCIYPIVKILYRFRHLLKRLDGNKLIHAINTVLQMEEIARM